MKSLLCLRGCFLLSFGLAVSLTLPLTSTAAAAISQDGAAPSAADPALEGILRGVENKYNHSKTLRLHFQQTYRQNQQVLREESGTLYLRKPRQMRWEYEHPEPKLFLTDGSILSLYVPSEKRLTETKISKSNDLQSPIRFLLGGLKFGKEFEKIERVSDVPPIETGDIVFKAAPRQMKDRLESVLLEVSSQFVIRRMILKEPGGIQTEFRFDNETFDPALSPDLFRFQAPQGTEVVRE